MKACIHCLVSGHVQGVMFRAATQDEAERLGLAGWARNLRDGRVEVLACGERDRLERLQEWLREGPEPARVEDLEVEEGPFDATLQRFEIR